MIHLEVSKMPTFGENIRNLRKSKGFTQDRFAREISNNQVNVSAWELGTRVPTLATIRHISEVFRVPISSLISYDESGLEDDYIREIADAIKQNPKLRRLFDHAKFLSDADLDAIMVLVNALTQKNPSSGNQL